MANSAMSRDSEGEPIAMRLNECCRGMRALVFTCVKVFFGCRPCDISRCQF